MKKILSFCFLWAISLALWGQSNGGYGGDFDPTNPENPREPSEIMKYELRLTADKGGSVNCNPSGNQLVAGTNIYLNANPNTGYRFRCWMEDGKVVSTSQWHYYTMPAKDVELKAVFAFEPEVPDNPDVIPLDYKVTVEASPSRGGNVNCSREEVHVGEYTYVSASPNSGYKFNGWMLDGKLVSRDTYYHFEMEGRHMHFTALFEFNPDTPGDPSNNPSGETTYYLKYTIDGQVCYSQQLPAGATITAISTPSKKGHTFSGWSNLPTVMPASNLEVSGTFVPNIYHITFKVGDDVLHEEDITYGATVVAPNAEEKEGHTLTWKNMPAKMPDSDVVVEGVYLPNVYKVVYMVDGEEYKSVDVTYATEIPAEAAPVREGHTFSGWSEIPATMPANDVIVTGTFSVNSYSVTFMLDSAEYKTVAVAYGSTISLPEVPAKEGHSFVGWKNVPNAMPAENIIIYGSYAVNKYLLSYKVGEEVLFSDSVAYGSAVVAPEAPAREGHTFAGWEGVPESMPAADVVCEGAYTVNIYKVYYYVGDELVHTDEVAYGEAIPEYVYEPVDGGVFVGWLGEQYDSMPAHDIRFEANISTGIMSLIQGNSHLVVYDLNGRRIMNVENLRSGIYIVNGRRVVIK